MALPRRQEEAMDNPRMNWDSAELVKIDGLAP
jgi:hypothetical protein